MAEHILGKDAIQVRFLLGAPLEVIIHYLPVAQLDRASFFYIEGWGFKSLRADQFSLFPLSGMWVRFLLAGPY